MEAQHYQQQESDGRLHHRWPEVLQICHLRRKQVPEVIMVEGRRQNNHYKE